jgi:hypothetical protein
MLVFVPALACSRISGLEDFVITGAGGAGGAGGAIGGGGTVDPCPNHVLELSETSTDRVEVVDDADFDDLTELSVEAWVWLDDAFENEGHIVSHHDHNETLGWALLVRTLQLELRVYSGSALVTATAGPLELQKWTHVAGVYDGAEARVYINGEVSNGIPAAPPADYGGPLVIGRGAYAASFTFLGRIDDVHVSRSTAYAGSFVPPVGRLTRVDDTVAMWRFEDATPSAARDEAGGHDGVIYGAEKVLGDRCPLEIEE